MDQQNKQQIHSLHPDFKCEVTFRIRLVPDYTKNPANTSTNNQWVSPKFKTGVDQFQRHRIMHRKIQCGSDRIFCDFTSLIKVQLDSDPISICEYRDGCAGQIVSSLLNFNFKVVSKVIVKMYRYLLPDVLIYIFINDRLKSSKSARYFDT
ncbi:hypothetical protein LOAG_02943 [Loa loa]|uniref:Uncharacterized protein n=1 Tax=Loa loa TaxID=7209 RepID=A0A1S0U5F7_LOALO|nr:hypothetical protein LOAG_02943 [Loa loa]EFO25543.1 hypothetical protein LOAG_02943 [Loa loa]